MTAEQWTLIKSVFARALDIPPAERVEWLERIAGLAPESRDEVLRLLAHSGGTTLLNRPVLDPASAPAQEPLLQPGDVIAARFEILDLLGRGGMGDVYLASDRELNLKVAMKTVRPDLAGDPAVVARMRLEVASARRVRHENICRIYDFHRETGPHGQPLAFLTMEVLYGEPLSRRLQAGPLPLDEAREVARQIIAGLSAIHEAGIVHRDLKSANVFLEPGDALRAVITDFGLAHDTTMPVTETLTQFGPNAIVGTPAYMAPEQLKAQGATTRSDLHALGAILFEMTTGRLPFPGDSPLAVALARLEGECPGPRELVPSLPVEWDRAARACLAADPEQRPDSAQAVWEILDGRRAYLDRRTVTRRRWWFTAGGAAAAASGAAWYWWPHKPAPEALYHFKLGQEYAKTRTKEAIQSALTEFREAARLDPAWAQAWGELADTYCTAANFSVLPVPEARRQAELAARAALQLSSRVGKAHSALAYVLSIDLQRWREAEPSFRRASQLAPDDPAIWRRYATYLGRQGRDDEAIRLANTALALDPALFSNNYQLISELYRARRFDEMLVRCEQLVKLHPTEVLSWLGLARAYEWNQRFAQAEAALATAERLPHDGKIDAFRATLYAAQGRLPEALAHANRIFASWQAGEQEANLAISVECAVRRKDNALAIIRTAIERNDETVIAIPTNPYADFLLGNPEYEAFRSRLGLR